MNVQEVMTREVITVSPEEPLKHVATLLLERRVSGVPVVDLDGRLVGVVSEGDLLFKEAGERPRRRPRFLGAATRTSEKRAATTAGDAMTSPALTVAPTATVAQAAALMLERDVNRLPVVDQGALVGIVTRADLIRAFARQDADIERELEEDVLLRTFSILPENVHVTVLNGEVTLTGEVETDGVRDTLLASLGQAPGIVAVHSKLKVRTDSHAPISERTRP
ncbi:MAG: CBS domain-containing protein [Gaiellaceae bacterium]